MKKFLIWVVLMLLSVTQVFAQNDDSCARPYGYGAVSFADGKVALSIPASFNETMIPQVIVFEPGSEETRWVTDIQKEENPVPPLVLSHDRTAIAFNVQGSNKDFNILRVVYSDTSKQTQDFLIEGVIDEILWTPDDTQLIVRRHVNGELFYEGYHTYTLLRLADGFQNTLLHIDLTGQTDNQLLNSYSFGDVNKAHNTLVYAIHSMGVLQLNEVSLTTGEQTLMYEIPLQEEYGIVDLGVSPDGSIINWEYRIGQGLITETNMMFFSRNTNRVMMFPQLFSSGGKWLNDTLVFGTFSEKNGQDIFTTIDFSEQQPGLTEHPVIVDQMDTVFNWIDNNTIQRSEGTTYDMSNAESGLSFADLIITIVNINITTGDKKDILEGVCLPKVVG